MHSNVQNVNQLVILTLKTITKKTTMMLMPLSSEEMMKISGRSNMTIIIQALWMRQIKLPTSDRLQPNQQVSNYSFTMDLFNLCLQKNLPQSMIEHKRLYKSYRLLPRRNYDYMSINYLQLIFIDHLNHLRSKKKECK